MKINQAIPMSYHRKMKNRIEESIFIISKRTQQLLIQHEVYGSVYASAMIKNLKEHKENGLADHLKEIVKSYK